MRASDDERLPGGAPLEPAEARLVELLRARGLGELARMCLHSFAEGLGNAERALQELERARGERLAVEAQEEVAPFPTIGAEHEERLGKEQADRWRALLGQPVSTPPGQVELRDDPSVWGPLFDAFLDARRRLLHAWLDAGRDAERVARDMSCDAQQVLAIRAATGGGEEGRVVLAGARDP
jgi:hypothetical protein